MNDKLAAYETRIEQLSERCRAFRLAYERLKDEIQYFRERAQTRADEIEASLLVDLDIADSTTQPQTQ